MSLRKAYRNRRVVLAKTISFFKGSFILTRTGDFSKKCELFFKEQKRNFFKKLVYAEQEATAAFPLKDLVIAHDLGEWNSAQERVVTLWMLQRQSVALATALLEEEGGICYAHFLSSQRSVFCIATVSSSQSRDFIFRIRRS